MVLVVVVVESSVSSVFSSTFALNLSHKSCRVKDVVSDQDVYLMSVVAVVATGVISVNVPFHMLNLAIKRLEQPSC